MDKKYKILANLLKNNVYRWQLLDSTDYYEEALIWASNWSESLGEENVKIEERQK